jgi:FixJ family two-component response regulator
LRVTTQGPQAQLVGVVDDDESVRGALLDALRSVGLLAAAFSSAEEFLSSGRLDEIGCLITDLKMPGMSGLQLQAKLLEDGRRYPIIFITGHGESRARAQAMSAGAIEFLDKPFDDNLLLEIVRRVIRPESP